MEEQLYNSIVSRYAINHEQEHLFPHYPWIRQSIQWFFTNMESSNLSLTKKS